MDLKLLVLESLKGIEILKDIDNLYDLLKPTIDTKNGDITLPCFSLAKILRKSPIQIADEIIASIKTDSFEKVENVNGYINFFLI